MSADHIAELIISIITLFTLFLVFKGLRTYDERSKTAVAGKFIIISILWIAAIGTLSLLGIFKQASIPPKPMFTALIALISIIIFSFTSAGAKILRLTPLHWLVFFQAFRILVELWFYYSYKTEVFPQIMSFEGANHDIYAGLLAIIVGWMVMKKTAGYKFFHIAFNIAGILLLANTLRAAVLSMPSSFQRYPFDERLLQLGSFPFIYLPAILVPVAFGMHISSLRQLSLKRAKKQSESGK